MTIFLLIASFFAVAWFQDAGRIEHQALLRELQQLPEQGAPYARVQAEIITFDEGLQFLRRYFWALVLLPAIVFWIAGSALGWVVRGFRAN